MRSTPREDEFYAHSKGHAGNWQTMRDHTQNVSTMAAGFADAFGCAEEGRLAGLLHDLGKYSALFQRRLAGQGKGLDHWSMGAWAALFRARQVNVAMAIQGHHIGLQQMNKASLGLLSPDKLATQDRREGVVTETNLDLLMQRLQNDGFQISQVDGAGKVLQGVGPMLATRMLFSCLVDAYYLDTSAHFEGTTERNIPSLEPQRAFELVLLVHREGTGFAQRRMLRLLARFADALRDG